MSDGAEMRSCANTLDTAMYNQMLGLPQRIASFVVEKLKLMSIFLLTWGPCFSGVEMAGQGALSAMYAIRCAWGVKLRQNHLLMVEIDDDKRDFLM